MSANHHTTEKIEQFVESHPDSDFSFAHIVLSDLNLWDHSIDFCLNPDVIDQWKQAQIERGIAPEVVHQRRDEIIAFLHELRSIPEDDRVGDEEDED